MMYVVPVVFRHPGTACRFLFVILSNAKDLLLYRYLSCLY